MLLHKIASSQLCVVYFCQHFWGFCFFSQNESMFYVVVRFHELCPSHCKL